MSDLAIPAFRGLPSITVHRTEVSEPLQLATVVVAYIIAVVQWKGATEIRVPGSYINVQESYTDVLALIARACQEAPHDPA